MIYILTCNYLANTSVNTYRVNDKTLLTFTYMIQNLGLKMPAKTVADDCLLFYYYFSEKIRLDILGELSAMQTIHLKCQVLFSLKLERHLLQFCLELLGFNSTLGTRSSQVLTEVCKVLIQAGRPSAMRF